MTMLTTTEPMMSDAITTPERFQTREELLQFIEQKTSETLEKNRVDRRVPWVTSGPVGRDSEGYSVLKAAAFALGYLAPEHAKEEIQVHTQLRDLYSGFGFVPHGGAQSFLIPLSTSHLPAFESKGAKLRDEIRGKMTVHADKYDPDEARWLLRKLPGRSKALGTLNDAQGGSLVRFPVLGEIIDLQRNMEVFAMAGAQEIAFPPNGRLQFPKITGGSTAFWVGEGNPISESQPATGHLDLQAKKLGVLVRVNNELLRFASPSAEGLIRMDMARSAALKADQAMLDGTGGTQIKGLIRYGITSHTASTVGANGNRLEPQDLALMEGKLPDAVGAPTAWVMRKSLFGNLMSRRAASVTASDGQGQFLFNPTRNPSDSPPLELYGTPVVRSSQVANNRAKGSASNLTYALLGYFPDWVVARMGVMEFLASGYGDSAMVNDQTYLRGIQHIDAGPRNTASFVISDVLINDE
jgi:HK97 family phage major capsid protein